MAEPIEKYRVTAVALNIRAAPTTAAKIIGYLQKKDVIEKLEVSPDGNWIKHKTGSITGWSSKKYLVKIVAGDAPPVFGEFPWMPIADREFGVVEIPGAAHNPRVLEYLSTVTNIGPTWRGQDETGKGGVCRYEVCLVHFMVEVGKKYRQAGKRLHLGVFPARWRWTCGLLFRRNPHALRDVHPCSGWKPGTHGKRHRRS
jgi:hypothetical protein